jgi:hypothetical protein
VEVAWCWFQGIYGVTIGNHNMVETALFLDLTTSRRDVSEMMGIGLWQLSQDGRQYYSHL